jgi:hypothetical protein
LLLQLFAELSNLVTKVGDRLQPLRVSLLQRLCNRRGEGRGVCWPLHPHDVDHAAGSIQ